MISAKEAAQAAVDYYQDVTNDHNQVSVAEVELSEDKKNWLITLAHRQSTSPFIGVEDKMAFKRFEINSENGEVISMKIRKV